MRRATIAVAAVAALVLVTGCGTADPGPTGSPTESVSVAPSPTPTETPLAEPTQPPEMERDDEVGAVAAAEYFMELYEYVLKTGDDEAWSLASGDECAFCSGLSDAVSARYADDGRFERESPAVYADFSIVSHDDVAGIYRVELTFSSIGVTSVDEDGTIASTAGPEQGTLTLGVIPAARGWVLLGGSADVESQS